MVSDLNLYANSVNITIESASYLTCNISERKEKFIKTYALSTKAKLFWIQAKTICVFSSLPVTAELNATV